MNEITSQELTQKNTSLTVETKHSLKRTHWFLRLVLVLVVATFVISSQRTMARGTLLSPTTKVSLVTVGPGTDLYSGFGHSVLWIFDPIMGLDNAYSYGTFSFETGNFYLKFLRGTLPYTISVAPLAPQAAYWQAENRWVSEQILNLSPNQKQKLYDFLEINHLPENREYQYKFFYDNCATRLSLALKSACGDSLKYEGYTHEKRSFRQWIDKYAYKQNPWADFGMDLAIGAPSDEIATAEQATFLPDNLSIAFADAKIKKGDQWIPLVAEKRELIAATPVQPAHWLTPTVLFWALALIILGFTYWQTSKNIINFTLDKILFTIVGLVGWLILLLWFGTNHGVTAWNYDILWAFPLWIPAIWYISPLKKPSWFQFFLIFYAFLLLCATGNLLKHNYVVIPILAMLIIRIYYMNNTLSKIPEK